MHRGQTHRALFTQPDWQEEHLSCVGKTSRSCTWAHSRVKWEVQTAPNSL